MNKKVTAVYYSATGNSKKSACTIAETLDQEYKQIDVTKYNAITEDYHFRQGGMGGQFRPETDEKCINCGLCVRECPQGAIDSDCKTIDNNKCIACFRCIRICPVKAKNMDHVEAYQNFAKDFNQKLAVRRENEFFIMN